MFGDFYNRTNSCNDAAKEYFGQLIIGFLEQLLKSNNEEDFELFTTQLFLNWKHLFKHNADALNKLCWQVRQLIVEDRKLSSTSRHWLLLATDFANNQYLLLPVYLFIHYQGQLKEKLHNFLMIAKSRTEESFENNWNETCTTKVIQTLRNKPQNTATVVCISSQESETEKKNNKMLKSQVINHQIVRTQTV